MKLKRHKNGARWEVSQSQTLPQGVWPLVYYYPHTGKYLPVIYLPNNRRIYGEEALSITTAWKRLEKMVENEIS